MKWWGYVHINGTLQAKRYFDQRDIHDAYESDFVRTVVPPFDAINRNDALAQIAMVTRLKKPTGGGG